jgi:hypothetical protein
VGEGADIQMGVGSLMETDGLSAADAWDHLRTLALGSELSMAEVAREVLAIRAEIAELTVDGTEGPPGAPGPPGRR